MMNFKLAVTAALSVLSLCAYGEPAKKPSESGQPAGIVLKGSDIVKPAIEDALMELAKRERISLSLDMRGTYPLLREDSPEPFDAAVVAVPKGGKLPSDLVVIPFAYQVAMVVVNAANPIEEISTDTLRKIYSKVSSGRIESWSQVGVRYAGLRNILALITGYSDGIYVELFKNSSFDGGELGDWVTMMKDSSEVLSNVRVNNSAIGIVGRVYDKNMVKILSVSDSSSGGNYRYSFLPNQASVFNGDYPMTLSYYIVFKRENAKKVKKLVSILLGSQIADRLDAKGFFSAPPESRKKSLFELDIL